MKVRFVGGPADGETHDLPEGTRFWNYALPPRRMSYAEPPEDQPCPSPFEFLRTVQYVVHKIVMFDEVRWLAFEPSQEEVVRLDLGRRLVELIENYQHPDGKVVGP